MKKLIVLGLVAIGFIMIFMFKNDSGANTIANNMQTETVVGDVVELSSKSIFYKNLYGQYPIVSANIYDLKEAEIHMGVQIMERFLAKDYLKNNVKLVDVKELKNKEITYSLANEKNVYFLDTETGKILSPDLMDDNVNNSDYVEDIVDSTKGYQVVESIIIRDEAGNVMLPVNGSFEVGSNTYFYGGGALLYAVRDNYKQITNLNSKFSGVKEILYVQNQGTILKAVVKLNSGSVVIQNVGSE